ncbi:MAG: hypothetical protein ABI389_02975 [Rhodanobacter sp.]
MPKAIKTQVKAPERVHGSLAIRRPESRRGTILANGLWQERQGLSKASGFAESFLELHNHAKTLLNTY